MLDVPKDLTSKLHKKVEEADKKGGEARDVKIQQNAQKLAPLAGFCENLLFHKILALLKNKELQLPAFLIIPEPLPSFDAPR